MEPDQPRVVTPPVDVEIVTEAFPAKGACPSCRAHIELDWVVCADCGTALRPMPGHPHTPPRESSLPSDESPDLAFVPLITGPKRPITIVGAGPVQSSGPSVTLDALVTHRSPGGAPPPAPPSESSVKPVTVVQEPSRPEEALVAAQRAKVEPAVPRTVEPAREKIEAIAEATGSSPNLSPTVVVFPSERTQAPRMSREDLGEMQTMIETAIRRAMRDYLAAQSAIAATAALPAPQVQESRGLVAAVGAGLLLGGSIAGLIVLNWDAWIRGDPVSVVGALQQLGLIGTAALAGAGAATFVLAVARGRRYARRKAARARSPTSL